MLKVDFFVLAGDAFDREQMRRRTFVTVVEGSDQRVAGSAECRIANGGT